MISHPAERTCVTRGGLIELLALASNGQRRDAGRHSFGIQNEHELSRCGPCEHIEGAERRPGDVFDLFSAETFAARGREESVLPAAARDFELEFSVEIG
ncbi:MAG: hypothetical protein ACLP0J_29585 [Solirubrobacteraceae bacterium]